MDVALLRSYCKVVGYTTSKGDCKWGKWYVSKKARTSCKVYRIGGSFVC